ncbi:ATP-binding protein [Actinoallomurus sp. CA-150999]|uniref:ATP-binding protein n=1 Tax=Actinoallomurus sp. CA-150999 TaxID=3239887 RepID=UPI003D9086B2
MTASARGRSQWQRFRSREVELSAVEDLLREVGAGRGGAMVVCGEAGIGKTALLEQALEVIPQARRLDAAGQEFETELPFTALHELCVPLLDGLDSLPGPQRAALEVAFAVREGAAPDRFRVGLAVLGLLTGAARERPVVCVVDDTDWIDDASAQVLAFVARRVGDSPVALLFALRGAVASGRFAGLPVRTVTGLGTEDALALLSSRIHAPLDERIRDQILAESRGNPLALIELVRGIGMPELAGGFGLPEALRVPERMEAAYRERLAALPEPTRRLLLVAAAEPLGEPALFWRAAELLGIGIEAITAAEEAGLLDVGVDVRFPHPLARSVVYRAAAPEERRAVHQALAQVTDPRRDADRRAWHRAQSVLLPDESIAGELERSADRAHARGGVAAAAGFLERAAALSPDPGRRAGRALAAARFKQQAGATEAAIRLVTTAQAGPLDARRHALAELLRVQLEMGGHGGAADRLLDAARGLESHDGLWAEMTYLQALTAAIGAGRLGESRRLAQDVRTARAAFVAAPWRPVQLLLDALAAQMIDGYTVAAPLLGKAMDALVPADSAQVPDGRWLRPACGVAPDLWDEHAWSTLAERYVRTVRESGALIELPVALRCLALYRIHTGEFGDAASLIAVAHDLAEANGTHGPSWADMALAAWRGDRERTAAMSETIAILARERGQGWVLSAVDYATAVLHNATGRYQVAAQTARAADEHDEPGLSAFVLPELIEAATRTGDVALAERALERLVQRTRTFGTEWALGIEARSRALLLAGSSAEDLYEEAIDRLGRSRAAVQLARARLVYGEWLRRESRRGDARVQLRIAHQELTTIGAAGFAARAARELSACGDRPPEATATPFDRLTAQELKIARLIAEGATSKEAAGRLFLSPRTIDAHVRNIFKKLNLTSRSQLRGLRTRLPADPHDTDMTY